MPQCINSCFRTYYLRLITNYIEHILYKQTSQYAKTCTSFYCTERCIAGDYSRCMSSLSVLHLGVSQVPLLYLTLARAS